VNGSTQDFKYTPGGRTHTITQNGHQVSYSYDADGTQLVRRDPGSITLYLPGEELTLDKNSGTITGTRFYSHNGVTVAVRVGDGNPIYQFSDPHGTVETQVPTTISGTGPPVRRHHDPYGNPLPNTDGTNLTGGTWTGQHGFLDKPQDDLTGLVDV